MRTAGVRKLKRSGGTVSWTGHVVAEDEYGTWIAGPAGTRLVWTDAESLETRRKSEAPIDVTVLVPSRGWWVAQWWSDGGITIDVSLPARLEHGTWVFEDLELDVFLGSTGRHGLVDLDEFFDSVDSGRIRPEEHERALRTAGELERMVRSREEPFGEIGWERFRAAGFGALPTLDPPEG